jgi:uncharacterized iron-regulated membrane protein
MEYWQRWLRQPQTVWLRKATFQLHLWSGIALGLYVLLVSVTGSILVYRNELYRAATRDPVVVAGTGPLLSDEQLKGLARRAYPGYSILNLSRGRTAGQTVAISLRDGQKRKNRLFNPFTGADLGDAVPVGIKMVSNLIALHDDLFGGPTGREINGLAALLLVGVTVTGIVVWWPGIKTWRRSLTLPRNSGWQRWIWGLHSMLGFWTFGVILLFAVSGVYLGLPEKFQDVLDRIEPLTDANARTRTVDQVTYWLAYLHIGRVNGIGLGCSGRGLCDMTVKLIWAVFGLVPAVMFVTGAIMWWNRVVKKKLRAATPRALTARASR